MDVLAELKSVGWYLSEAGLKKLPPPNNKCNDVNEIIKLCLDIDFREIAEGALSSSRQGENLKGPIVLQLQWARNIAAPKVSETSSAPRMLCLELTDGQTFIRALEVEKVPALDLNVPPGTKIRFRAENLPLLGGYILLKNQDLQILGGHVAALEEKWEATRTGLLYNKIGQKAIGATAPPPWVPFGKSLDALTESVGGLSKDKNFKSLQAAMEKDKDNKDNEEFKAMRAEAIAAAMKAGTKRVFGGGGQNILDFNIKKILDKGYSEEEARQILRATNNNLERALYNLKRRHESKQNETNGVKASASASGPTSTRSAGQSRDTGSKRSGGGGMKGGDDGAIPTKPMGNVSLFDFLTDKLPANVQQPTTTQTTTTTTSNENQRNTTKRQATSSQAQVASSNNQDAKVSSNNSKASSQNTTHQHQQQHQQQQQQRQQSEYKSGGGYAEKDNRDNRQQGGRYSKSDSSNDTNKKERFNSGAGAAGGASGGSNYSNRQNSNRGNRSSYDNNENSNRRAPNDSERGSSRKTPINNSSNQNTEVNANMNSSHQSGGGGRTRGGGGDNHQNNRSNSNRNQNQHRNNHQQQQQQQHHQQQQQQQQYTNAPPQKQQNYAPRQRPQSMSSQSTHTPNNSNNMSMAAVPITISVGSVAPLNHMAPPTTVLPNGFAYDPSKIIGFQSKEANEYAMNLMRSQGKTMGAEIVIQAPPPAHAHALAPPPPPRQTNQPPPPPQPQIQFLPQPAPMPASIATAVPVAVPVAAPPPTHHFGMTTGVPVDSWNWKIGDLCMAKYWEDGQYYEAEITGICDKTCVVYYIGYNNHEEVLKTDCLPITDANHRPINNYNFQQAIHVSAPPPPPHQQQQAGPPQQQHQPPHMRTAMRYYVPPHKRNH